MSRGNVTLYGLLVAVIAVLSIWVYMSSILSDNEKLVSDKESNERTIKQQELRNKFQQESAKRQVEVVKEQGSIEKKVTEEGNNEDDFITASPSE